MTMALMILLKRVFVIYSLKKFQTESPLVIFSFQEYSKSQLLSQNDMRRFPKQVRTRKFLEDVAGLPLSSVSQFDLKMQTSHLCVKLVYTF